MVKILSVNDPKENAKAFLSQIKADTSAGKVPLNYDHRDGLANSPTNSEEWERSCIGVNSLLLSLGMMGGKKVFGDVKNLKNFSGENFNEFRESVLNALEEECKKVAKRKYAGFAGQITSLLAYHQVDFERINLLASLVNDASSPFYSEAPDQNAKLLEDMAAYLLGEGERPNVGTVLKLEIFDRADGIRSDVKGKAVRIIGKTGGSKALDADPQVIRRVSPSGNVFKFPKEFPKK